MALPEKRAVAKTALSPVQSSMNRLVRTWEIARRGFFVMFSICLIARIPPFLVRFLYVLAWPDAAANPTAVNVGAAAVVTVYELSSLFLGLLALLYAVSETGAGRSVTVSEALRGAVLRAKAAIAAFAWWLGIVGLGLVCFLIPGLVLMAQFVFSGFLVVEKGMSGKAALMRSKALVMRVPKIVFANLIVLAFLCLGVIVVVQGPLGFLLGFSFGVFALPDDSLVVAILFDLIRLAAAQLVPVAGSVFLWALYKDVLESGPPDSGTAEPELISL